MKRLPKRLMCALLAGSAALLSSPAQASGGEGWWHDLFVERDGSDVANVRYGQGELGVVLPTYHRVYLYPAWRAIVLGADGLATHPVADDSMDRAQGRYVGGWVDLSDAKSPVGAWVAARGEALKLAPKSMRKEPAYRDGFVNCTDSAFKFATQTLGEVSRRTDATPERVREWVLAQDQVFAACLDLSRRPAKSGDAAVPGGVPVSLPTGEPAYWRQLREYQIAAAAFYSGDYARSANLFAAIGATPGHPMQGLGAYLALRSRVREAEVPLTAQERQSEKPVPRVATAIEKIDQQLKAILADPQLSAIHADARATWRTAQFRLAPAARFETLSRELGDITRDPSEDDHLGDWRRLANDLLDDFSPDAQEKTPSRELEARLRGQHEYFDWIRTIQRCGLNPKDCPQSRSHAMKRWQQSPKDAGTRSAWLVAVALLADRMPADVEQALRAVPRKAPEYLTVRHELSRLYRLQGQPAKARAVSDEVLAGLDVKKPVSVSAINLFRAERFAAATSVADATAWVDRLPAGARGIDTGEPASALAIAGVMPRPDLDGVAWFNSRLSVANLLTLSADQRLSRFTRLRIAQATWLRADLLGKPDIAARAAAIAAQIAPVLAEPARTYAETKDPQMRRHRLLLAAMRLNLKADVDAFSENPEEALTNAAQTPEHDLDITASMWCHIGQPAESLPSVSSPDLSSDAARRDAEMRALGRLKTATGFVGDHVMSWARTHPDDPDLPWLLHVVVSSTRGGCLDKDSRQLSKAAHGLLHKRFPTSEWAAQTKYYY